MPRAPGQNVAVDVAIRQLSSFEKADNFPHLKLQNRIILLSESGRGSLKPFCEIRIPKNAPSPVTRICPRIGKFAAPMHFRIEKQGVQMPVRPHLLELMSGGCFSDPVP